MKPTVQEDRVITKCAAADIVIAGSTVHKSFIYLFFVTVILDQNVSVLTHDFIKFAQPEMGRRRK